MVRPCYCWDCSEREIVARRLYREALIAQRLESMPIGPQLRELIQHALNWAWKKTRRCTRSYPPGRDSPLRQPIAKDPGRTSIRSRGAIAGWSQLRAATCTFGVTLRGARSAAGLIAVLGSLAGQVPREVRQHLRYGCFRDFCMFQCRCGIDRPACATTAMLEPGARAVRAGSFPWRSDLTAPVRANDETSARPRDIHDLGRSRSMMRTGLAPGSHAGRARGAADR